MYLNVNKAYQAYDSKLAKAEKNDCVVRSLASATGSSYETAHQYAKDMFGREDKKGTSNLAISTQMLRLEDSGMKIADKTFEVEVLSKSRVKNRYKLHGDVIWRQKTLKSFVKDNSKGTYLVMVAKHALTVKDGEVLDWDTNKFLPTRKVQSAYKLTPKSSNHMGKQLNLFQNV